MIDLATPRMGPDTDLAIPGNSLEGLKDLLQHIYYGNHPSYPGALLSVVEIGSYLGVSSALIAEYASTLHVIDCWGAPDYTDCDWAQPEWGAVEAECRERLAGTGAVIHKMTSIEALPNFTNESLDLVYIDADHSQEAVGLDMDIWWPKVRPGGWLAGHDFHLPGVRAAVLDRFTADKVKTFSDTSWLVMKPGRAEPAPISDEEVIRRFHQISYERWGPVNTQWMGTQTIKSPMDLITYQEIIHQVRPTLIIETGTYSGGSALFLAQMQELAGIDGHVLTVDVNRSPPAHLGKPWPTHKRVLHVQGDSTSSRVLRDADMLGANRDDSTVMVILDSDHHQAHVARELELYAPLVTVGSYLIVEDTNINGHPVLEEFGPGPAEAVDAFLASPAGAGFRRDESCERFLLTMNPGGFLRRVA